MCNFFPFYTCLIDLINYVDVDVSIVYSIKLSCNKSHLCLKSNHSSHRFLAICYLLTVSKSWLSPSTPHPACLCSQGPCRGVWIYTKQAASKLLSCVKQDNHAVSRIQLIHQDSCDDHSLTPSPHQYSSFLALYWPRIILFSSKCQ